MELQESITSMELNQRTIMNEEEILTQAHGVNDNTAHIDNILSEFEITEAVEERKELINSGSLIDKQSFRVIFLGGAEIGKSIKPEYSSLQMLDASNEQAVIAIDTLYDCIMDIPQLHWLLNPSGKWAQRGFAIGSFFIPFCFALRNDVRAEKSVKKSTIEAEKKNIKGHQQVDMSDWGKVA